VSDWIAIEGGTFSEEKHLYKDETGLIVPSATQVFDILAMNDFSKVKEEDMEWKRGFGNAVHKGVELVVFDQLDWSTCSEEIIPAITGIESFLGELRYKPEKAEERKIVTLNGMKYGMTLDHRGTCWYHNVERKIVVDVKTGTKFSPTWRWQGGGYVPSLTYLLLIAQVSKDGKVTPHWVEPIKAQREFGILLAAAMLKLNAGLAQIKGGIDGDD
jgi:hypothetical protein